MSFLKSIWRGSSKHKKLSEDFVLGKQEAESNTNLEGVSFDVKYLGSTLVETPNGEGSTAEAIKTVITMAKASGKKLPRVSLTVGLNGIRMVDNATDEIHLDVSIYRISYCSADATYDHVFAFIATNSNETMECHAFLCPKRKVAQAVTLTIAQSFTMAYELWQISQTKHDSLPEKTDNNSDDRQNEDDPIKEMVKIEAIPKSRSHSLLIDLSSEVPSCAEPANWVCFEEDEFENLNSSFARLAASRSSSSNTPVSTPLNPPPRSISLDPSPSSAGTKNPWNEQHNKLSEDFVLGKQEAESNTNLEGVSFDVKYLGSTLVETPNGEGSTAEAIKTVITMAKASGKKLPRVSLTVGLNGIRMVDNATDEIHLDVSIYRISYCSADATYDHVFAFIATNSNETMECHAFLCPKRKVAQAVTLTIAQSFTMAYELWQISQTKHDSLPEKTDNNSDDRQNEDDPIKEMVKIEAIPKSRSHSLLIDLSSEVPSCAEPANWVCFEEDEFENLNSSFARLAASRSSSSNTPVSTPLNPPPRSISLDPSPSSAGTKNPWNEQHNSIDLFCS